MLTFGVASVSTFTCSGEPTSRKSAATRTSNVRAADDGESSKTANESLYKGGPEAAVPQVRKFATGPCAALRAPPLPTVSSRSSGFLIIVIAGPSREVTVMTSYVPSDDERAFFTAVAPVFAEHRRGECPVRAL